MPRWRQSPSQKGSGEPNDAPAVRICRRGDGSAIYAVGRGVSPSRMVGWSPRDRRSGGPRLSRPFGEAALMPLHLVRPARRAGRRLTGNAAFQAAHHPPTNPPPTNPPTHHPPTHHPPTHHPPTHHQPTTHQPTTHPPTSHHPPPTNHPPHKIFVRAFTLPADLVYLFRFVWKNVAR